MTATHGRGCLRAGAQSSESLPNSHRDFPHVTFTRARRTTDLWGLLLHCCACAVVPGFGSVPSYARQRAEGASCHLFGGSALCRLSAVLEWGRECHNPQNSFVAQQFSYCFPLQWRRRQDMVFSTGRSPG